MRSRVVAGLLLVSLIAAGCGGGTQGTSPESESAMATPTRTPVPSPTPTPVPTPFATQLEEADALVTPLGAGAAPLDLIVAFGTIWVALHHGDSVVRIDPDSGEVIAEISTGFNSGPGWFGAADDSLWVTNQNAMGMSRIDPETNEATGPFGSEPPCGAMAVVGDVAWMDACDTPAMVGVDTTTSESAGRVSLPEAMDPVAVDGKLWGLGESGIYRLDAAGEAMALVDDCCGGFLAGIRGAEIWIAQEDALAVYDTESEHSLKAVPLGGVSTVAFDRGSGWAVTAEGELSEIDLGSHRVLRTMAFGDNPVRVASRDGELWFSDFNSGDITRLQPPE